MRLLVVEDEAKTADFLAKGPQRVRLCGGCRAEWSGRALFY